MNTASTHEPDVLCFICEQSMESHNPVTSIQMVCCSTGEWYHKKCLKEKANALEDDFSCPKCCDVDAFRENMLMNGVFIPKSSAIALYTSFAADNNNVENEPPRKKKRVHKDWIYERTFKTKKEADKFLKDENWSYQYRNNSENGMRITYRCNLLKFRGEQCAAAIYLLFDSRSSDIQLFRADTEHTHQNHPNAVETLSEGVKEAVKSLYKLNVTKPKMVTVNLVKQGFDPPPKPLLTNF